MIMQKLLKNLGFFWNREFVFDLPIHDKSHILAYYHRLMPSMVWDAAVLEGNPMTFPEVLILMEGITVGGHKISDQEQVVRLAVSSRALLEMIKKDSFQCDKKTFSMFHQLVANHEALEWGHFRGEGREKRFTPHVCLGNRSSFYKPLPTKNNAPQLNVLFEKGNAFLQTLIPVEQAFGFFLFGTLHQFFFDGNKRTSRMIMNGILMSNGHYPISVPANRKAEFNECLIDFYATKDATNMFAFLHSCAEPEPAIRMEM